jgi:DNA-binding MarR family transcriptional regulator
MNSTGIPNDPLSRFSLSVFRINGLLMRHGDSITRAIGQSSARWQVLGRVGYQSQTVAQMAREMGHARQSVQRIADVLAKEGLVIYKDNPADRRAQLLELMPQGAQILAAIYALNDEWTRYLMTKLDPEQLIAVADALEQIAQILEANEPRPRIPYDTEEE